MYKKIVIKNSQQQLLLTPRLQQALHALQLPLPSLIEWLQGEISQNPILDSQAKPRQEEGISELDFTRSSFEVLDALDESFTQAVFGEEEKTLEQPLSHSSSLFEHLMAQANEVFTTPKERHMAAQIIGNLDDRGFFSEGIEDYGSSEVISLLKKIQTFDPPGIAARNIQECLLIQLQLQGKGNGLTHELIEHHFDDVLHRRFSRLSTLFSLNRKSLENIIKRDLAPLSTRPAAAFHHDPAPPLIPDLTLHEAGEGWRVEVHEEDLPPLKIDHFTSEQLIGEKRIFLHYLAAAKQLVQAIVKRRTTLCKIALYVAKIQNDFLRGRSSVPKPLKLQEVAAHLHLHPSTLTRAVADKVLFSPRGVILLRTLFPSSISQTTPLPISHVQIHELLEQLIAQEDKKVPLSDQALANAIQRLGVPCARRTIAKYRGRLRILPAAQRKKNSEAL